jgi:trehalose synthase-fused probable maltokinase
VLSVEGSFGEATLLSLQEAIPNLGTGWTLACEQVAQTVDGTETDLAPWALLGRAMADLHRVLASEGPDAIGTLPLHPPDLQAVAVAAMALAREVLTELASTELPPAASGLAQVLRLRTAGLLRRIKAPLIQDGTCHRQRIHGDIHLGQVLWDGSTFSIIDFEGEPGRAVEERRRKQSPAKDLAGMLRSFDYAARAGVPLGTGHAGELLAHEWRNKARKAFRTAYEDAIGAEPFLPSDLVLRNKLVNLFELEKAFYELKYEMRNRPDWVEIPMAGLLDLVGSPA